MRNRFRLKFILQKEHALVHKGVCLCLVCGVFPAGPRGVSPDVLFQTEAVADSGHGECISCRIPLPHQRKSASPCVTSLHSPATMAELGCASWRQAEDVSFERDAYGQPRMLGKGPFGRVRVQFPFAATFAVCSLLHSIICPRQNTQQHLTAQNRVGTQDVAQQGCGTQHELSRYCKSPCSTLALR